MSRIALITNWTGFPDIVTDDPNLAVYSIDDNVPEDRIYQMTGSIRRVSPAEFDQLLGSGVVHVAGDKPILEQAARAHLARSGGKPKLAIVRDGED